MNISSLYLNKSSIGKWILPAIMSLVMLFLTYFTIGVFGVKFGSGLFAMDNKSISDISKLFAYVFANSMFILTMFTGRIDRFRSIFFILIALTFPIGFIPEIYELRGHLMVATFENFIKGEVPYCHIVIPQTLLPIIFNQTINFPGSLMSGNHTMAAMIVLWFAATVGTGRGWCSWICFFGGWEDFFSRLRKKPVIKNISNKYQYVPYAILTAVVLLSLAFTVPAYCLWLCPFKSVSEFIQVLSPVNVIQTVLFVLLFIALVVVLPILSKKRTQCAYFCPFGAMQGLFDKLNVFDVRIDVKKCVRCKKCMNECPVNSITEASIENGKTGNHCVKCGKCIDLCPKKAVSYHVKGTGIGGISGTVARTSFLFLCYMIIATMGSSFLANALYRILLLITTGSMINS
jgi:ferredoxin-type protein NapH